MTDEFEIQPMDEYNRSLVSNVHSPVHPPGWENPAPVPTHNPVVIGAGSGVVRVL